MKAELYTVLYPIQIGSQIKNEHKVYIYQPKSFQFERTRFFQIYDIDHVIRKIEFYVFSLKEIRDNRLGVTSIKMKFEVPCGHCQIN